MTSKNVLTNTEVDDLLDFVSRAPEISIQNAEIGQLDALHTITSIFDVLLWRLFCKWSGAKIYDTHYFMHYSGQLGRIKGVIESFPKHYLAIHFNLDNKLHKGAILISDRYLNAVINRNFELNSSELSSDEFAICKLFSDELIELFKTAWRTFLNVNFCVEKIELSPEILINDEHRVYNVINKGGFSRDAIPSFGWWVPMGFLIENSTSLLNPVPIFAAE